MINDNIKLSGYVCITLRDKDGNIKQQDEGNNLIVTTGKAFVASALASASASPFTHVAIGTSSAATGLAQTALLGTELSRVAATVTNPTTTTTLFSAMFGVGVGTGTIEEVGIFNDPVVGTMFSRYLTGTYVKSATDTLSILWTITVA